MLVVSFLGILWGGAGKIASPDRRVLQDYHREYLESPQSRGVVIVELAPYEGMVPSLVVTPDRFGGAASRGQLLRDQLESREVELPDFGEVVKLAVLLHGRNGRKEDLLPVAERFCAVGFVCVLPDLPAHGESEIETVGYGSREFERKLAWRVAEEVSCEASLENLPRVLWGMSMGGSFAIHGVAENPDDWQRMVIVSSSDSLGGVIDDTWAGSFRFLVDEMVEARGGPEVRRVRPVDLVGSLKTPILFVHGDSDDLINEKRGRALFEASSGEKEFLTVEGGTHANVLVTEAPVYAAMAEWLLAQ